MNNEQLWHNVTASNVKKACEIVCVSDHQPVGHHKKVITLLNYTKIVREKRV